MCYICGCSGQLLACVLCTHVYHSQCIALPLPSIPQSPLQCPQCQVRVLIQWLDILLTRLFLLAVSIIFLKAYYSTIFC